jgi:hypothetical protein
LFVIVVGTKFEETEDQFRSHIEATVSGEKAVSVFYEFSGAVLPKCPRTNDFAAFAMLPFAMTTGQSLHIEGMVHREQLENLEECQDAFSLWHPDKFKKIPISADEEIPTSQRQGRDAVMAFSGGLDASYALHAHRHGLLGRRSNDIRAGILVHGFDIPLQQTPHFKKAEADAAASLRHYGVPLTRVRTNWTSLRAPWRQSFIFAMASVLQQFSEVSSRAVIATDEAYDGEVLGWGSNGITNQMMGFPGFPIDFTGGGVSRTLKARALAEETTVLDHLRVCTKLLGEGANCGRCEKCIRTKLNFLAGAGLDLPRLHGRPTPEDIRAIVINHEVALALYEELLRQGAWSGLRDLESAVRDLVAMGVTGSAPVGNKNIPPTPAKRLRQNTRAQRRWLKSILKYPIGRVPQ